MLQKLIFKHLGFTDSEAKEQFGFLMDAFKYGAPPHGGMAFGFDRIVMLLAGSNQIRDVIALPKTTSATSLMDNSPSNVDKAQLEELGLVIKSNSINKIIIGFFLTFLSFVIITLIQYWIDIGRSVNIGWQILAYSICLFTYFKS